MTAPRKRKRSWSWWICRDGRGTGLSQLSVGERQRVALARALANDPVLLLANEPTGNLDSENANRVLDLLALLRSERKLSLLMVTHSNEVAERADRIIRMKGRPHRRGRHRSYRAVAGVSDLYDFNDGVEA